jgi:RND family efflux transporter MFP subunit
MKFKPQGKIAVAAIVIAVSAGLIYLFNALAPEAAVEPREEALPAVRIISVETTSTPVEIPSQGIIAAPKETSLAAEVGGNVTSVSKKFEVGEDFEEGDVLIEMEQADYAAALAQAEANVADAELNRALELGRARQAERDWKSVGRSGAPSELVLRTPHLESAKKKLVSAQAAVEKAKRDMERTKIRAPYDCRVRATHTEVGSFIAPGSRIADVYETGGFEVRLPVSLDDYAFIEGSGIGGEITFSATIAGEEKTWKGSIIRDEGVIDRRSRSVYLVGKIDSAEQDKFLSPGLFVKATITGKQLDNIVSLPRKALYGKDQVYIIDGKDQLNFRTVDVARTEQGRIIIRSGLEPGERVCITNLAAAIDKMKVAVLKPEEEEASPVETPVADRSGS